MLILLIIVSAAAVYLGVRLVVLRKSIRSASGQLHDITQALGENRIVKLAAPDRALTELISVVNEALEEIRREKTRDCHREAALKEQIEHISHDLRTPLTSILGYLSLIDDKGLDSEDRASLEAVRRKAHSLARLIDQFYDLSRLRGGDAPVTLEPLDLGRLLREAVTSQYTLLAERALQVSADIPEEPVTISADTHAVERIFDNLLQNASRYAKTTLRVALVVNGDQVTITFENDTDPLTRRQLDHFFVPFYKADSARSQEGTGLGLTIARYLAGSIGAQLNAELVTRKETSWLKLSFEI